MESINSRSSRVFTRAALGFSMVVGLALVCGAAETARDVDGLVRVDDRQVDHLYVLPEADFSIYKRVRLDPAEVSFSERWNPTARRSRGARRISAADIENIKSTVSTEFDRTLADELQRHGYMLVDQNADDVLRITPMIVNLYISAPSAGLRPGTRTFVANTGHMTLVAEARDSVTGELLARVIDTQRGRRTGMMQLASGVSNMADARRAFGQWATVLRTGLDDARQNPAAGEATSEKEATREGEGAPR